MVRRNSRKRMNVPTNHQTISRTVVFVGIEDQRPINVERREQGNRTPQYTARGRERFESGHVRFTFVKEEGV